MQKLLAALVAVGVIAVAMPVNANSVNRNVEFMLDYAGFTAMPVGYATMSDGRVVTIEEAFNEAAARAGDVDLAALVLGAAAPGDAAGAGDIWIFEVGYGACPGGTILAGPVGMNTYYHGQLWTYRGFAGTQESTGAGVLIDWTTKLLGGYYSSGAATYGVSDRFCFTFFGLYIWFPFLNGVASSK